MKKKALTYLYIIFSGFLSAVAYHLFVIPNRFASAGIGGICAMIQYTLGINVGYMTLLFNIPLALAVYFLVSKPLSIRAFVYTIAFSGFMVLFEQPFMAPLLEPLIYQTESTSKIMGPILGGVVMGYSNAQMLSIGSSQGGMYYVSTLIKKYKPQFNFFWISISLNVIVAVASYFVLGDGIEPVLMCILYFFVSNMVNSMLTKKAHRAVRVEIITQEPDAISRDIIEKLHHSATLLPGKGIFKGKETSVLVCIVNTTQTAALTKILKQYPHTFAAMSYVDEVIGNFKRLDSDGKLNPQLLDTGDVRVD